MKTQPKSKPLSSFASREIEWLWQSRIPFGCVTLLEGDGGVGKSSIIAALGSAISSGRALPEDTSKDHAGVLLLATEDDPEVVLRPRFEANGADLDRVFFYDQSMLLNRAGLISLDEEISALGIKLVVIDPIVSFLGQNVDTSKATDVRSVMGPLHELAKKHKCAIVVVRHWNKSSTATASQKGAGSVDFRNAARSVLQVIKGDEQHFLTLEKSNYGATGKTLTFCLQGKVISWTGASELSADDILKDRLQNNEESRSELSEAVTFLEEELSEGPVEASKVLNSAKDLGISVATLKRARSKLKISSKKMPGKNCYYLYLPNQTPNAPDQAQGAHSTLSEPHEPHPILFPMEAMV